MARNAGNKALHSDMDKFRNTALQHALGIEEKKKLQAKVADLVLEAFDLPSGSNADPAHPVLKDSLLFQACLQVFRPLDLDDLVCERNIDERCGYPLCPKPRGKIKGAGEKIWNQRGGKDFKLVDKTDIEGFCSKLCADRTAFVRGQMSSEPAWLRETQNKVVLLDEIRQARDLTAAMEALSTNTQDEDVRARLEALSIERGDSSVAGEAPEVSVVEKENQSLRTRPPRKAKQDQVEGHQPRKVRFTEQDR